MTDSEMVFFLPVTDSGMVVLPVADSEKVILPVTLERWFYL